MAAPVYKTTKADFEFFCKRVAVWLEWMNITQWNIHFDHCPIRNAEAATDIDVHAMTATFRFSSRLTNYENFQKTKIDEAAQHEAWHLFLAKMSHIARERFDITERSINKIEEEVLNALVSLTIRRKKRSRAKERPS